MKKALQFFTLIALLSVPAALYSTTESDATTEERAKQPRYTNALDLMKDFLNLNVKRNVPFEYWAKQFQELIKQQDSKKQRSLVPFMNELKRELDNPKRSHIQIGSILKKHKDKFGEPELVNYVSGFNGADLLKILKARLNSSAQQ